MAVSKDFLQDHLSGAAGIRSSASGLAARLRRAVVKTARESGAVEPLAAAQRAVVGDGARATRRRAVRISIEAASIEALPGPARAVERDASHAGGVASTAARGGGRGWLPGWHCSQAGR